MFTYILWYLAVFVLGGGISGLFLSYGGPWSDVPSNVGLGALAGLQVAVSWPFWPFVLFRDWVDGY
jgi:hypothetical protein